MRAWRRCDAENEFEKGVEKMERKREEDDRTHGVVIFYHDDADGQCAAAVALRSLPANAAVHCCPVQYPDSQRFWRLDGDRLELMSYLGENKLIPPQDLREFWLVDFSFDEAGMMGLRELTQWLGCRFIWFDHHKSKQDMYDLMDDCIPLGCRDTSKASCLAVWEWLHENEPPPPAVKYIADRDMWRFEYGDETRAFHELYSLAPLSPKSKRWDFFLKDRRYMAIDRPFSKEGDWEEEREEMTATGMFLYGARKNRALMQAVKYGEFFDSNLFRRFSESEQDTARLLLLRCYPDSEQAHWCIKTFDGLNVVAYQWISGDAGGGAFDVTTNLYSDGTVDVGAFAKEHGGGGHKAAAGWTGKNVRFTKPLFLEAVRLLDGEA